MKNTTRKILGWGILLNLMQLLVWVIIYNSPSGCGMSPMLNYFTSWFVVLIFWIAVSLFIVALSLLFE